MRVVLKLSGEALSGDKGGPFDDGIIDGVASQLAELLKNKFEISIVIGGGNFWRGRSSEAWLDRCVSDRIGMLATVMNGMYLAERFRANGIEASVSTPFQVGAFTQVFEKRQTLRQMAGGAVVIHSGGTGHPFFSTDTVAALRAAELEADRVLYAKNVDGVYEENPATHPEARKYKSLSYAKAIADRLAAADLSAMAISMESGTDSYLFGLAEENGVLTACGSDDGRRFGTRISVNIEEEFYV